MIRGYLKDGGITMSNSSGKDIVYLKHNTSRLPTSIMDGSVIQQGVMNIIKGKTVIRGNNGALRKIITK